MASFERGNLIAGINQLEAFQSKTWAQVSPLGAALAEGLIHAAQVVIDASQD